MAAAAVAAEVAVVSAATAVLDDTETLQFTGDAPVIKPAPCTGSSHNCFPLVDPKTECNHFESSNVTNLFIAETGKSAPAKCESSMTRSISSVSCRSMPHSNWPETGNSI